MSKVLQVRGLPEASHATLARAAAREGMSLTAYARAQLEEAARRIESTERNEAIIEASRTAFTGTVTRDQILRAKDQGRR
jgi:plasmid stability protein